MAKQKNRRGITDLGDAIPDFLRDAVLARLDDPKTAELWPSLWACLNPVFEGATLRRQAGKITIKIIGPNIIVTVTNPTEILDIDIVVTSLTTAFEEVDAALKSGNFHVKPAWQKNKKKPPTILDEVI